MLKSSIVDTRVRLLPSQKLLDFLEEHKQHYHEVPKNVANIMNQKGYSLPLSTKIINPQKNVIKRPKIDYKLLENLTSDIDESPEKPVATTLSEGEDDEKPPEQHKTVLFLEDIHWLKDTLDELRKREVSEVFLHELIETCDLILPENEFKPRNPDLEARCQRLREEQHNREYQKMTKNVDAGLKNYPEDTVAYQLKSLNKQIIAVVQFIFSVAAGFTFGFFGVNLMVGPLPFGFRILLGVIVALIIALAEMYFLAKKLHEYDEVLDAPKRKQAQQATPSKRPVQAKTSDVQTLKPHAD
ncbi:hypothetical protein KR026_001974 [Drosophila bipectinata]|nr:hypothetical protein KR026_001974 [Drosophila bipectinata]